MTSLTEDQRTDALIALSVLRGTLQDPNADQFDIENAMTSTKILGSLLGIDIEAEETEHERERKAYHREMQVLEQRIADTMLPEAVDEEWADLLERNEYFDGETEVRWAYFEGLCERHGVEIAQART